MSDLLISIYNNPAKIEHLTLDEWSKVITYGRDQNMLGRLWWRIQTHNCDRFVPNKVKVHFANSDTFVAQQKININRELSDIASCFSARNIPCTVLKGAAYIALSSDTSNGRIFNDIDILVDKAQLREAEIALMTLGYFHKKETDYDKRYFREWMHEIQPLVHNKRFTTIDLHHNILPLTNKKHFNANRLHSVLLPQFNMQTLDAVDRFIHSATHLFTEGEFPHAIRDITDLIILYNEINDVNASRLLLDRANALGLETYIELALYFVLLNIGDKKGFDYVEQLINRRFITAHVTLPSYYFVFSADTVEQDGIRQHFALFWLYMRSHLIKMPIRILIPHLCRKFIYNFKERFFEDKTKDGQNDRLG